MKLWLFFLSVVLCVNAFGTSIWTNASGGSWSTGTNWLGGAPTNNADTRITNANSKVVVIDATTPATNLNLSRLLLWGPFNVTNTLSVTDLGSTNPLLLSSSLAVGRGGALMMTNSSLIDSGSLSISNGASVRLTNSSLSLNGQFQTFSIYGGSFTLDSGSLTVSDSNTVARVGRSTNGSLIINGGTAQIAGGLTLGESLNHSIGLLQVTSGSLNLGSFVSLAEASNTMGTILMTGGQLVATNGTNGLLRIGNNGVGQMLLSSATVRATSLSVAEGSPAFFPTGTVTIANSQLVIGQNFMDPNFTNIVSIGKYGLGQMTVSNSGIVVLPDTSVARHSNSVGTLTVLTNGFVGFSDDLSIGRFSGATGTVVVAGGQLVNTNNPIWVGRDGVGKLSISDGLVQTPSLFVAMVPTNSGRGTLNLSGGTVLVSSNLVLGDASISTGQVAMANGFLIVTNSANSALLALASGNFAITDGQIFADNVVLTNTGASFTFNGGSLHTKSTTISNGLPFVVGNGTNAANLDLLGGTHLFADGLIISSNATLTGCGTIIGPVTIFGTDATTCPPMPPNITQQPISQTNTQGAKVTFSVTATGDRPLAYQWRFSGIMADIPGATNSTLMLTNIQPTNSGNYRVRVSNSSGSATSVVAVLRVLVPATLTNTMLVGTNLNFSFGTVSGLSYSVEYKTNLTDAAWLPLSTRIGDGTVFSITNVIQPVPSRFFRVRVQ